jgi:transposase-like protein
MSQPLRLSWRYCEAEFILCAVRWYFRYALSGRDIEERMLGRRVSVVHTMVFRCFPKKWWRTIDRQADSAGDAKSGLKRSTSTRGGSCQRDWH